MNTLKYLIPLITSVILVGCGDSATATSQTPKAKAPADTMTPKDTEIPAATVKPAAPTLSLSFTATKAFHFAWQAVAGATSYKLKEGITTGSGYDIIATTTATSFDHIVPLYGRLNAKYILESCNAIGCTASIEIFTSSRISQISSSIGYFKASNTGFNDYFGNSVSLSADGNTLAVGTKSEDSNSQVINAGEGNDDANSAGAVYVFTRNNTTSKAWSQQAYLKASNAGISDSFGYSVSLSADGNTLAVGASGEASNGSAQTNNSVASAGAVYVFIRTVTASDAEVDMEWSQQAYLKAGHTDIDDLFGQSVSLSDDGNTLAVGAAKEDSNAIGVGIDSGNDQRSEAGAVYVFTRSGERAAAAWSEPAYLKASNTGETDHFGFSVSLSDDGSTLVVGAPYENSDSQEIGVGEGNALDNDSANNAGAVYVFTYSDAQWSQQAYIKAINAEAVDNFGYSVSVSDDGNTLAVGATGEDSAATGVFNTPQGIIASIDSGAVYVFTRNNSSLWAHQAYLKASNTGEGDNFGFIVSVSADGNTLAVSTQFKDSNGTGIDGAEGDGAIKSGAAYTFTRSESTWSQQAYLKASNAASGDLFGSSVALSSDGGTLAVGASGEDSNATGVNKDQTDDTGRDSGAVYVY